MVKIKIKLTPIELKVFAYYLNSAYTSLDISTLEDLNSYVIMRSFFYRLHRLYKPEKRHFTINLSLSEASIIETYILPLMDGALSYGDAIGLAIATTLRKEIEMQTFNHISLLNATRC